MTRTAIILLWLTAAFHGGWSQTAPPKVFRIGGLELSPYGYGVMETQPHKALDSTNTDFKNYYAHLGLWVGR